MAVRVLGLTLLAQILKNSVFQATALTQPSVAKQSVELQYIWMAFNQGNIKSGVVNLQLPSQPERKIGHHCWHRAVINPAALSQVIVKTLLRLSAPIGSHHFISHNNYPRVSV